MKYASKIFIAILTMVFGLTIEASAQQDSLKQKEQVEQLFDKEATVMKPNEKPRLYHIRNVNFHGVKHMSERTLRSVAGLIPGDTIYLPSGYIANSISRLWAQRSFADVKIGASIDGDSVDMEVFLKERPRVHTWNFVGEGITNSKKKELAEKLQLRRNSELSDYIIDKNEKLIKKEFADKGYRNTEVKAMITNDTTGLQNVVHVTFHIDRKEKVKVGEITFDGNDMFSDKRLRRTFKKTHQKSINFFRSTKFNPKEFENDKDLLVDFYNSQGYRNATVIADSVYDISSNRIGIHLDVAEGEKFYIRNVNWVGNSKFETEFLQRMFGVNKGDTYDRKSMHKRLGIGREADASDNNSISSLYQNDGYLMSQIDPSEIIVGKDSIDVEVRIFEGKQFKINEIGISGNTRVNDEVIRRELSVYPGQLYNRALLMYSLRQLMSMGHFDAEQLQPDVQPVSNDLVNINFPLVEQASDQFNNAGGWGAGSFVGSVGITLNNISTRDFFNKSKWTPYPMGQNQKFSVSGQTNGTYYKAISASFTDPWVGGHKPNSLTVSAHWSEQNNAYYIWQTSTMYFRTMGLGIGLGKRMKWPDPNFTIYTEAQYRRYALNNWDYFIMKDGVANELSLKVAFGRSTVDQPIYPRSGTEFSVTATITPPYSLWDGIDYSNSDLPDRTRYKWIEYHRWEMKGRWFQPLTRDRKLILMAKAEMGYLGNYNKNKVSPFQRFEVGGDGMSGYTLYGVDVIGLRGYEDGALDPRGSNYSVAYNKYTMELRYPVVMKDQSQVFVLGFLEGGSGFNSWEEFSPFKIKRSAGLGVRLYLPIVGLIGIDWGYGFDSAMGHTSRSGSRFHFTMGQSF